MLLFVLRVLMLEKEACCSSKALEAGVVKGGGVLNALLLCWNDGFCVFRNSDMSISVCCDGGTYGGGCFTGGLLYGFGFCRGGGALFVVFETLMISRTMRMITSATI